jgi:predicted HicB family RNase H-like nuclease
MTISTETLPKRIKVSVRIKQEKLLAAKKEAARRNMSLNAYVVGLLEKEMDRAEKGFTD